ncbi:MAG: L,D-transpeptidase family protein, partial [Parcubacteria group bacterium]
MEFKEFVEKKHWYSSFWADVVWVLLGVLALLFIFGTQYATGEFGFSAKLEKSQIKTNESAVVDFSQPVAYKAVEKNFEISPEAKISFAWSDNYQKLEISPVKTFEAEKTYIVKIDPQTSFSVSSLMGKKAGPLNLSFSVDSPPEVVSISPASGDPNVKIDSKIKASFDKTTTGYDVNFVVEPFSNFEISFDDARKNFTISPKGNLDFARDYAISVKLAPSSAKLSAPQMPEIFRANFKTEPSPPPPPAPVEEVVLPEDKAAGIIADSQVATPEAKITEGKYIDINLAKQQLSIFENGERLGTYKVSTGKKGMATPTGTFKVMSKAGRAYSKKYNLYMPYWMQFTGQGHGIHELPEWKNGYKEGANHLGIPVSHGCVRLGVGPAAKVYGWADTGTPIV